MDKSIRFPDESTRLPPTGIHPIGDYTNDLCVCRREDKRSVIIYVQLYKPEDDPDYEDPDGSIFAWQNREEAIEQIEWIKRIYCVIHKSEPEDHPRIQR